MALSINANRRDTIQCDNQGFFRQIKNRLIFEIKEASEELMLGWHYLRQGRSWAPEMSQAFHQTLFHCAQANCVTGTQLQWTNDTLMNSYTAMAKVEGEIKNISRSRKALQKEVNECSKLVNTYTTELSEAQANYLELQDKITRHVKEVDKKEQAATFFAVAAVVTALFAPYVAVIAAIGFAGQMMSIHEAKQKLTELSQLRDEKQELLNNQKRLQEKAITARNNAQQRLREKQQELSALQAEQSALQKFKWHLAEVDARLKRLHTHLSTLQGKAQCTASASLAVARNPYTSTTTLVTNATALTQQMYQVNGFLNLQCIDQNYVSQTLMLMGEVESCLDSQWY